MLCVGITSASSITLNCTFKNHYSYWGEKYACLVNDLTTFQDDRRVTAVIGTHLEGKTNDDVEKVLAEYQYCPHLPTNIGSFFKNLEIFYVMHSNVSHLSTNDLDGLDKLRIFDVSYNPIKRLHRDFFVGHQSIEIISFYDCNLSFIEEGALSPLVNLKEAHFQYNQCVDYRGDDASLLPSLMETIKEYCQDPHRTNFNRPPTMPEFSGETDDSMEDFTTFRAPERTTTRRPSIKEKILKPSSVNEDSFVRRNAYVIMFFLILIIAVFGAILYKFNAFNRQNWR